MSDLITDAMVEAAAKAFANHEYRINGPEMVPYCTCGWTATERYGVAEYDQHVARLTLEAAAALIAAAPLIAAKALRDAAEAMADTAKPRGESIDAAHIDRLRGWSAATFGPGPRLNAILDHIGKEMREIAAQPLDIFEWVDVVILGLDGAWRAGWESQQIIDAIREKQAHNEARSWPDWRTSDPDRAIEHIPEAKP